MISLLPLALLIFGQNSSPTETLLLRGRPQSLTIMEPVRNPTATAVLFLPGDGGFRGSAVTFARTIVQCDYAVYVLDTKAYLQSFTTPAPTLSSSDMQADLRTIVAWIRARGARNVVLTGWSQGAGMAVLVAQDRAAGVAGVVTLGLPSSALLAWHWKDTIATLARREPDEPHFDLKPLMAGVSPAPLCMIYGASDEYVTPEVARTLFDAAQQPKRLIEIPNGNHRFDEARPELYQALRDALAWIIAASP